MFQSLKKQFPKSLRAKHIHILNDFFEYLEIENCISYSKENHGILKLPNYKNTKNASGPTQKVGAEAIYVSATEAKQQDIPKIISQLHKNGVLIIETPYKNLAFWNALKETDVTQVIVDTYYFGFIFTRKEQAKEEFYIRL